MTTATQPRLKARYNNTIKQQLAKDLGINNDMQIPKLEKIVINMGVGRATQQPSLLEKAVDDFRSSFQRSESVDKQEMQETEDLDTLTDSGVGADESDAGSQDTSRGAEELATDDGNDEAEGEADAPAPT